VEGDQASCSDERRVHPEIRLDAFSGVIAVDEEEVDRRAAQDVNDLCKRLLAVRVGGEIDKPLTRTTEGAIKPRTSLVGRTRSERHIDGGVDRNKQRVL